MIRGRRAVVFLVLSAVASLLAYFRSATSSSTVRSLRTSVPQVVGLGEYFDGEKQDALEDARVDGTNHPPFAHPEYPHSAKPAPSSSLSISNESIGTIIPTNNSPREYTRNLVMARMTAENVTWLDENDLGPSLTKVIYVADDRKATFHPPKNKGHEVMIYLTYILEFYENLPDVSIFMHSHRYTWHNDDLLNWDAAEMIKRLSSERVLRNGYMNMRCHWKPGCPEWIYPGRVERDHEKPEQAMVADAWVELFPGKPIPTVLAQPCCSQFALSRDRILSIPKKNYAHYRDWLLRSPIRDTMSGRIFEYIWQVIFTDQALFCPNQRACYCDGFGVCFEDEASFDKYFEIRFHQKQAEYALADWEEKAAKIEAFRSANPDDSGWREDVETGELEVPEFGKDQELRTTIRDLGADLEFRRLEAIQRGIDPRVRAESDGRVWHDGDGF